MKIRTDFVTNSSSSCFCVSLNLEFDNGEKLVFHGFREDGDNDKAMSCDNCEGSETIHNLNCLAESFSEIAGARNNISMLKTILQRSLGIRTCSSLSGATELTDASMKVNACVYGEYTYEADASRMLGVENVEDSNLGQLTEEARETIDDSQAEDGSKSYTFYMNEDGMVEVEYEEGEGYTPKKFNPEDIGEVYSIYYTLEFRKTDFEAIKENVISWLQNKSYNLALDQGDDEETFFTQLGLWTGDSGDDETIYMEAEFDDCSELGYSYVELLKVLSPYFVNEDLGHIYTDNGPMNVIAEDGELRFEADD